MPFDSPVSAPPGHIYSPVERRSIRLEEFFGPKNQQRHGTRISNLNFFGLSRTLTPNQVDFIAPIEDAIDESGVLSAPIRFRGARTIDNLGAAVIAHVDPGVTLSAGLATDLTGSSRNEILDRFERATVQTIPDRSGLSTYIRINPKYSGSADVIQEKFGEDAVSRIGKVQYYGTHLPDSSKVEEALFARQANMLHITTHELGHAASQQSGLSVGSMFDDTHLAAKSLGFRNRYNLDTIFLGKNRDFIRAITTDALEEARAESFAFHIDAKTSIGARAKQLFEDFSTVQRQALDLGDEKLADDFGYRTTYGSFSDGGFGYYVDDRVSRGQLKKVGRTVSRQESKAADLMLRARITAHGTFMGAVNYGEFEEGLSDIRASISAQNREIIARDHGEKYARIYDRAVRRQKRIGIQTGSDAAPSSIVTRLRGKISSAGTVGSDSPRAFRSIANDVTEFLSERGMRSSLGVPNKSGLKQMAGQLSETVAKGLSGSKNLKVLGAAALIGAGGLAINSMN